MLKNIDINQKDNEYYNHEKSFLYPFIKNGSNKILDIGCANGNLGKGLLNIGKAEELIGIEINKDAATEAAKKYFKVYQGDIEELQLQFHEQFDYVICGDIIEHLKSPCDLLTKISTWLTKNGLLLLTVPNVRNWRIIRDLVFNGRWEYVQSGILDNTHLRFFTKKSIYRILLNCGFEVQFTKIIIHGKRKKLFNRLSMNLLNEFIGFQIFMIAKKKEI